MSWSGLHAGTHCSGYPFPYTTHHLPPPLGHSRLALPVLALSPHQTLSSRPLSLFRGPSLNIPNVPVFLFPFSLLAPLLPLAHPACSSYLGLVLLALTPALLALFPHRSLAATFPTHSLHDCPPGLLLPSFLSLSPRPPTLSPCPSPAWISLRCLAFAFVGHTFLVFTLPFALGLQISTNMYGSF